MKIIDRYIQAQLAKGFLIVLIILVSMFSFLDFVEELDDTTLGNYHVLDAAVFVIMTVPERALWLIPICALLGCLVGLSLLANGNELTAMRAAGVSGRRIVWSVVRTTGLLLVVVVIFAQVIIPKLGERAWRDRALAIAGDIVLRKESGTNFWFRDGRRFISIRDMAYGRIPTGIEIYEFDDDASLSVFTEAREAKRDENGVWILQDVTRKRTRGMKLELELERLPSLAWDGFLSPKQGAVIELDAESLSPTDLYYYARDLRARGQNSNRYELAFWRKLNIPIATIAMVLIALPFAFAPHERGGIGKQVLSGGAIGVVFYLTDQVIAQIGLLTTFNPALTALGPACVLLMIGLVALRTVR